ncbi:MAG: ATP synthase F1 subunit delta [Polyangiaceae bacterium]
MISSQVSRRYARAILDIGIETNTAQRLVSEMNDLAAAFEQSADLRSAMENPLVSQEAKRAIVEDLVTKSGAGETTKNTLLLLTDRRRVRALPAIAKALAELFDVQKGVLRAEVTTAAPLTEAYRARLKAELERLSGHKIVLDERTDESLLAGVIAQVGDTIYDGSLKSRLQQMQSSLLQTN